MKYSSVKGRQFPNRSISDWRVNFPWSVETDSRCFPTLNNNERIHVKSMINIEKKVSPHDFDLADCRDMCWRNIMEVQRNVSMNSIDLSYQKDLCSITPVYQVNLGAFSHHLLSIITNNNLLELMVIIYILSSLLHVNILACILCKTVNTLLLVKAS